jgi:hypothetical protein
MIGEATYIACRHKQQLLPSTKQELPAWIYVRGKVQFKSMCCLEGIEFIVSYQKNYKTLGCMNLWLSINIYIYI